MRLLVVVPAWNEEPSIRSVVAALGARGLPTLVVDDGSDDGTSDAARAAGATVLRLPVNLGVGAALRCAFRYAVDHRFDAVVQVDADGQHPVDAIPALVAEAEATGAHLVNGSRFVSGDPGMHVGYLRRSVMRVLARSASRATNTRLTDATSGFRLIRQPLLREFARSFPAHYLGDTYEALVTAGRAGYRVSEIPVSMKPREQGESSASPLAAVRFTLRALIVAGARLHFEITPAPPRTSEAVNHDQVGLEL